MAQQINVPGVGLLAFPDGMSEPDMAAAIQKNFPQIHQQQTPPPEASWGGALKGDAEAAMSVGSGALMGGLGGLARTVNRVLPAFGNPEAKAGTEADINALQDRLTYKPQTPEGQYAVSKLAGVTQPVADLAHKVTAGVVGEDNVGATSDALASAGLLKGIVGGGVKSSVSPVVQQATTRAQQLKTLANEGVRLDSSQELGGKGALTLKNFANDGPYGSPAAFQAEQGGDFTAAALKQMGIPAREATPAVMSAGKKVLKNNYNQVAERTSMTLDDPLATDLDSILQGAKESLTPENYSVIKAKADSLLTMMENNGSKLSGTQYQKFQSGLGDIAKDGGKAPYVTQLRQAVTGMLRRQADPADVKLLDKTNQQYGAMKAIQKSITPDNQVSPSLLYNSMDTVKGANQSVFGEGANSRLMDLAQAGKAVLGTNTANSGTGTRLMGAASIVQAGNALVAAATGHFEVAGALAATAAAAGMSQKAAQALIYTKAGKAFLQRAAQTKLAAGKAIRGPLGQIPEGSLGVIGTNQAAQPQQPSQ